MRKNAIKDIDLKLTGIEFFVNKGYEGSYLSWESKIGFGEYTIYKGKDGVWRADSETMDCNEDKEFITELMRQFIEKLEIRM